MNRLKLLFALGFAVTTFGCAVNRARSHALSMRLDGSCLTQPLVFTGCDSEEPPNCKRMEPVHYKRGCGVMGVR